MKFYFILCLMTFARLNSQSSIIENKVFYYVFDKSEAEIINVEDLKSININQRKTSWNRFCGGTISHDYELLVLFQTIKFNLTFKSLAEFYNSINSEENRKEYLDHGVTIESSYMIPESNAVYTSTINNRLGEFWHTYSILTNFGMITMKIASNTPIKVSTRRYFNSLIVKEDYKGLPTKTFLGNINWEEVIMTGVTKALSPGLKLPKAKGN